LAAKRKVAKEELKCSKPTNHLRRIGNGGFRATDIERDAEGVAIAQRVAKVQTRQHASAKLANQRRMLRYVAHRRRSDQNRNASA
jgi:hypothetical protein